jgi:hypothetical protein
MGKKGVVPEQAGRARGNARAIEPRKLSYSPQRRKGRKVSQRKSTIWSLSLPLIQKVNGENDAIHCFLGDLRVFAPLR